MRKSRLPRILVQFTKLSMLLESTVWKRLPEPVPSQAENKKKAQWGLGGIESSERKDLSSLQLLTISYVPLGHSPPQGSHILSPFLSTSILSGGQALTQDV